jgi:hypothetical protein
MPKVNDLKAYFRELATKSGLGEEFSKQLEAALDNKQFTDGFVPRPDYSHDLDSVRDRTYKEYMEKDGKAAKDFHAQELEKFNQYIAGLDELKRYRETYGALDGNGNGGGGNVNTGTLSKEELAKMGFVDKDTFQTMLTEVLGRRDNAVLDLLDVRERHMGVFKKALDVKAFNEEWNKHPEWGGSLKIAYDKYVETDLKKIETDAWEAKIAAAREEGVRDGYSRRSLPTDKGGQEFTSPMFNRQTDIDKMSEPEQEKHSREAFFAGFREGK